MNAEASLAGRIAAFLATEPDDPRSVDSLATELLTESLTELGQLDKLRQLAYDQHRAIGALRRLYGGDDFWDDTNAEHLWDLGESDEGWALLSPEEPDVFDDFDETGEYMIPPRGHGESWGDDR